MGERGSWASDTVERKAKRLCTEEHIAAKQQFEDFGGVARPLLRRDVPANLVYLVARDAAEFRELQQLRVSGGGNREKAFDLVTDDCVCARVEPEIDVGPSVQYFRRVLLTEEVDEEGITFAIIVDHDPRRIYGCRIRTLRDYG